MIALYSSGPVTPSMRNWPLGVVLAERAPQAGGLDEHREADLALELLVLGGVEVVDDGGGDVGVDVEGGRAGRPVARALLAVDRPPRERRAREAELGRVRPRDVEGHGTASAARRPRRTGACRSAPAARTSRCPRTCARRTRCPVSPFAGIGRCSVRAPGLQDVEQAEPDGLLDLHVTVDLDVRALPELVEELRAARPAARPSRPAPPRPSRPPPGRSARAVTAARTSRSR